MEIAGIVLVGFHLGQSRRKKLVFIISCRVVPDTDLAGYPTWPDTRYPAGYPAK